MKKKSIVRDKSYVFAIRMVRLADYLREEKREFVLNKQLLRSGTAVGALVREAEYAQSTADFINKLHVALKEANETSYWLQLLKDTDYIEEKMYQSLYVDCDELIALLVSSIKTLKKPTLSS